MLKAQGKSHNKMVTENTEQYVESDLNVEEFEMKNNLNKEKDNFRELVKSSRNERKRIVRDAPELNEINEDTEVNKKKKK